MVARSSSSAEARGTIGTKMVAGVRSDDGDHVTSSLSLSSSCFHCCRPSRDVAPLYGGRGKELEMGLRGEGRPGQDCLSYEGR